MTVEAIRKLPRSEKLKLMEALWEELSRDDQFVESPAWQAVELVQTEQHLKEGKEEILEWDAAKKTLRNDAQ